MNAFELLKGDHQKVKGLLEQLDKTTERGLKTREELFNKVMQELQVHTKIEEVIFYPALKEAKETHEIVLEAYEEHHVVDQLLAELEATPFDSEEWGAKLTVLKENVEHHIEEEEGEMFKEARKVLGKDQIEELGTQMEAAKKEQKRAVGA
jgi:hypothetical protein